MSKVVVAGGFDPLHRGHVRHIQAAAKLIGIGGKLIVVLMRDDQMIAKKKFCFMPQDERREILLALKGVDKVFMSIDKSTTCADSLRALLPNVFAKGGDRTPDNMPQVELDVCKEIGCVIVYGVGGEKIQSSSKLTNRMGGS